jgi:pimeloyl-ACP methyl ester carboxylesterase
MDKHTWLLLAALMFLFSACNGSGGGESDAAGDDAAAEDVSVEEVEDIAAEEADDAAEEDAPADMPVEDAEEEELVELIWTACDTTEWPLGYPLPPADVECTTIDVPLVHGDPASGFITLTVARQKARLHPTGRAIFNFAGGPGGTAVGQSGTIPRYMPMVRDAFDLIYVDQRGTGGSGYMDCPGGYPETTAQWEACAARYSDYDLNHYLTVDAAHDIEAVRRALGYDRIYLRGGSYGTRMGLEYMRQYPDSIVAVVLDGLAPPDLDLFGLSIESFDRGVAMLVEDCAADADCLAVSPTLAEDLAARREALIAQPRPILVSGMADVEDEELYLIFLEAFLYYAQWRYRVPEAVHLAVSGDNSQWNRLMSEASGYTITDRARSSAALPAPLRPMPPSVHGWARDYVSPGLFITVACAEFFPNSGGIAALQAILDGQTWGMGTYLDLAEACDAWDVDPIDASLRRAVVSDLPTLLMSGEIDLNTWPEWGDMAAGTLSGGTHLVVPYATHSVVSVTCASSIMSQFLLADGRIGDVDTACLETIPHPGW